MSVDLRFCPHCNATLRAYVDDIGGRCEFCRLFVGAHRARDHAAGEARAAGFMANAALRQRAEPVAAGPAAAGLRRAADRMSCKVERMRMVDYDQAARLDDRLASVAQILATFRTWKQARASAREP